MFVSVCLDCSGPDHEEKLSSLLVQYGFKKVQRHLFEHTGMSDTGLKRLKFDLDRQTDSYDVLRMYQYPVDATMVITMLKDKKWRNLVAQV